MTRSESIVKFIKEAFSDFGIIYDNYFTYYENDDYENRIEYPLILPNRKLDMKAVTYAAEVLGMDVSDVLSRKESVILDRLGKYPYIFHYGALKEAVKAAYLADSYEKVHLLEVLFDKNLEHLYERKYNYRSVIDRLYKKLEEMDKYIPGTFHKGEHIGRISISTNTFCSFEPINEMVESFLSMCERSKELFLKAVRDKLNADEILEYNFLVSVLGIRDQQCPMDYLYYSVLVNLKDVYSWLTEENFYSVIYFNDDKYFSPWRCREFVQNKALVQRYANIFPETKKKMREFAVDALDFNCRFVWSDDMLTPEEQKIWDEADYSEIEYLEYSNPRFQDKTVTIYIKKNADELGEDYNAAQSINALFSPPKLGGITVVKRPSYFDLLNKHNIGWHDRMVEFVRNGKPYDYVQRLDREKRCAGGIGND